MFYNLAPDLFKGLSYIAMSTKKSNSVNTKFKALNLTEASEIIHRLGLKKHPEGGYYREIFRSKQKVRWQNKTLSAGTAIHFLLREGDKSWCHRIPQDEVWHFYEGDPLELVCFSETGLNLKRIFLSSLNRTYIVPGNFWQAARPLGKYSLIGCTVSPGFEFNMFEILSHFPEKKLLFKKKVKGISDFI